MQSKFFESAEVGATYAGEVKSITDYGVFVDIGGVDGLIRKPDLTWKKIKHRITSYNVCYTKLLRIIRNNQCI